MFPELFSAVSVAGTHSRLQHYDTLRDTASDLHTCLLIGDVSIVANISLPAVLVKVKTTGLIIYSPSTRKVIRLQGLLFSVQVLS